MIDNDFEYCCKCGDLFFKEDIKNKKCKCCIDKNN